MPDESHCYIGKLRCGCIVAAVFDDGDKKRVFRDIKRFLDCGYIVERTAAPVSIGGCRHKPETVSAEPARNQV